MNDNNAQALKNITLSTELFAAEYINNNFVNISGSENLGTLQLTGNIIIGNNSHAYGIQSTALGEGCQTGAFGFEIISANKSQMKIYCKSTYVPETVVGQVFSLATNGAADRVGKITAVDEVDSTTISFTVDTWHLKLDVLPSDSVIYFPDDLTIGYRVVGNYAHAEGLSSKAVGNYSHAEGVLTEAGKYGHAEGYDTYASWAAHSEGQHTRANSGCTHAEGRWTIADHYTSHVEGHTCSALGWHSWAGGARACVDEEHTGAFVWNGISTLYSGTDPMPEQAEWGGYYGPIYHSHERGTFNINPSFGLSGFYIGEKNLAQILKDNVPDCHVLSNETFYLDEITVDDLLSCIATKLGAKVYKTRT